MLALQLAGLRQELARTRLQVDRETSVLRDVARDAAAGQHPRWTSRPSGRQLWAAYYLSERPLSSTRRSLYTTYPHVPAGRKARLSSWPTRR